MSATTDTATLGHRIFGAPDGTPAGRGGEVSDPATGEIVAGVSFATADVVDRAVPAAAAWGPRLAGQARGC